MALNDPKIVRQGNRGLIGLRVPGIRYTNRFSNYSGKIFSHLGLVRMLLAYLVLLDLDFFSRRDDFGGAGPLARGRPPGRPARTQEKPDQGVRRGRGRPPHIWLRLCCFVGQAGSLPPVVNRRWPVVSSRACVNRSSPQSATDQNELLERSHCRPPPRIIRNVQNVISLKRHVGTLPLHDLLELDHDLLLSSPRLSPVNISLSRRVRRESLSQRQQLQHASIRAVAHRKRARPLHVPHNVNLPCLRHTNLLAAKQPDISLP